MKTKFKVFKGSYDSLEEDIKKYQEEHHLEIKNVVVLLDNYNAKTIVGVVFKRSSEFDKIQRYIGATNEDQWISRTIKSN